MGGCDEVTTAGTFICSSEEEDGQRTICLIIASITTWAKVCWH